MSKYILKPEYALRSFKKLPKMYAVKEKEECRVLQKKEWDFLIKCDGKTEIDIESEKAWSDSPRVQSMVKEANQNEVLTSWQKNIYHDNYYFPTIEWRITDRCNYNCLHCYNAKDESAKAAIWDYDEACDFIKQAAECGINCIRLSGGEPMMHEHFLDIVKKIYENGMFLDEVVTNGFYLTPEILDEIATYGKKPLFKVSFDGFGYHDWMRDCKGAEKNAIRAFDLLKEKGFPILVNAQINRKNKDSFKKTMDYFDSLGVSTLRFIRTTETPRWEMKAGDAAMPYVEYYETMLDVLREYNSKPRNMSLTLWAFGIFTPKNKTFRMINNICKESEYRDTMPGCSTVRKQICVGADGKIYPCSQCSGICDSRNMVFGNVKKEGLKKLLTEGAYIDVATLTAGDIKANNSKCSSCEHFKQCQGGCRGLGYLATGSFYGENPAMCELYELDYESKVQDILSDWTNITASPGHIEIEQC